MNARCLSAAALSSLALLALIGLMLPAGVVGRPPKPYLPHEVELPASNGYTLTVYGIPPARGRAGRVEVSAWNAMTSSSYSAPGRVTGKGMWASLGRFGKVSLRFDRTGVKQVRSPCSDSVDRVVAGTFAGSVEFEGEGGYTSLTDDGVVAEPLDHDHWECSWSDAYRGGRRGASLQVLSRYAETQVQEASHGGPVRYIAVAVNRYGRVEVRRLAEVVGEPAGFLWPQDLKRATVRPPAPFSGEARYTQLSPRITHWEGNLRVDFAGFPDHPLTPGPSWTGMHHGYCKQEAPMVAPESGPPLGLCLEGWGG